MDIKPIIKRISLAFFKGQKEKTFTFDGNAKVKGANGTGKTSLATAWFWVFADRDYDLNGNPAIRPLDVEECTPRVEIEMDIDGRTVTVAKIQHCTKKTKDGVTTTALSNTYEVNSVECGERDFKAKLESYGFDFKKFLALSHPDAFTGQKAVEMRDILFSMASEKSDLEIALLTNGAADVAELLKNYTMEEVKAMQNASIRKIKEEYGKDGEILRAKIEGLERAKSDVDVAELELGKKAVHKLIERNLEQQKALDNSTAEQDKAHSELMSLQFEKSDYERKENESLVLDKQKIRVDISGLAEVISETNRAIIQKKNEIDYRKKQNEEYERNIKLAREQWNATNNAQFDENEQICRSCGQLLPTDKISANKAEFEAWKKKNLEEITNRGNSLKKMIDENNSVIQSLTEAVEIQCKEVERCIKEQEELEAKLSSLPTSVDLSEDKEYLAILNKISEAEERLKSFTDVSGTRRQLLDEERKLRSDLAEFEKKIASADNSAIDEKIANLRATATQYEQNKANAEKILAQLELVSHKKNEMLTEDINKHFEIVKWQMFEYAKNGSYKEVCIPLIDGKRFGESTNTGREILAKLDIIKGLQKFYGMYLPVFLDGAECLSSETWERINMDCQLIALAVSEDKEIVIE